MEILQSVRKPIKHSDKPSDYEVSYVERTAPALRDELFAELEKVAIPYIPYKNPQVIKSGPNAGKLKLVVERGTVIGRIGRTMNMGVIRTRAHGYNASKYSRKYPEVLKKVIAYGNAIVPVGFRYNAITINCGVQAKRHHDGSNVGKSVIVGFGDYTGGKLRVYHKQSDEYDAMDIHDRPLMFNGSLLEHETEPFEGKRYTIIFYKQNSDAPIEGYETIGKESEPLV
jgi:hypothetical protein